MQARNYRLSSIAAYMILLEQHDKSGVQWSMGIVKYLSFDIAYNKVLKVLITSLVGADIIGVNCRFDHNLSLQTIGLTKGHCWEMKVKSKSLARNYPPPLNNICPFM